MSSLDYAKSELERLNLFDEEGDFYGGMTGNAVMELMKVFSEQAHSGMSAGVVLNAFTRLANFKPLSPLTGEDDEWEEISEGVFQNKRYSAVFKRGKDGRAYDVDGKIFSNDGGEIWYTSNESKVYIEFPYVVPDHPEKVLIDADSAREDI